MKSWRGFLICAVALYIGASAGEGLRRWTLFGGGPDYLILVLGGLALFANRSAGAVIGFFDGWIYGALAGANLWQYVLTRTIAGFLIAWMAESGFERNVFSALLVGIAAVFLCRMGLMFLAPPPTIMPFVGDTIRTAVYNGILAVLLFAALNRILGPRRS
jgi:hypothetical protein